MSVLPYELTMIAAYMGARRIIGYQGEMPWSIETETQFFRETTRGSIVIMGRVTWESILRRNGHRLLGRTNLVLSRNDQDGGGYVPVFSVEDALRVVEQLRHENQKVFVIGGEQVYKAFLPYASRLLISRIVHRRGTLPQHADAFFPCFNKKEFPIHRRIRSGQDGRYRIVFEERKRVSR